MRKPASTPWKIGSTLGVLIAAWAASPVMAEVESQTVPIWEVPTQARKGRFDIVLTSLKSDVFGIDLSTDPRATSLIRDLDRYQSILAAHREARRTAYDEALVEVEAKAIDSKLHEAMVKALDAHDLADDVETLRQDRRIGTLVARTEQAAVDAEQGGDWIEATELYRALDLLYDNTSAHYHEQLKRTLQHVRVLRLYDPQRAHDLAVARALRDNPDEKIKPYKPRDETWEQRVEGATISILKKVLTYAKDRHVDAPSYRSLLLGSLDTLLILANDRSMGRVFPAFNDPEKVDSFRQFLMSQRQELMERHKPLSSKDVNVLNNDIIRANKRSVRLPKEVIAYEMTEGAMAVLDDFTAVIWPFDSQSFSRNTRGNFTGVGIQISFRDKRLIVVSPLPDSPALRAHILPGDVIATVDGKSTEGWSLDQAVREITGESGTIVELGIERTGTSDLMKFPLRRAHIEIESVRGWQLLPKGHGQWDYWIDEAQGIAYVRLSQFIPQTADGLDDALDALEAKGSLSALILDLRFNPGGLLNSSVEVADRFIDHGLIVSTVDAASKATGPTHNARPDRTRPRLPLVVLINQHTASASEIVAGAIQDYQLGTIVGVRSFGKGSVQDLFPLANGQAYLKLTTQYYRLPLKRIIHRKAASKTWGIEPDVELRMTDKQVREAVEFRRDADVIRDEAGTAIEDTGPVPMAADLLANSLDPQLEAALLVLKTHLVCNQLVKLAKRPVPVTAP